MLALIAIKNECRDPSLDSYNNANKTKKTTKIDGEIAAKTTELDRIDTAIDDRREVLFRVKAERTKHKSHLGRLSEINASIK
jgi:hypothetical protein